MPAMALTRQHVGAQNTRRRWSCPEIAGNNARGGILERRFDPAQVTSDIDSDAGHTAR
jgi:hypothetical protein